VPSAAVRQSNCYFSSSDAAFADRYDADRRYDAALAGDVPLEGGWRIYSSGPGLFIAMFVRHFLGLRVAARSLTIDPVIPPTLDGLRATVALWGKPVDVSYAIGGTPGAAVEAALNGTPLSGARVANRYRDAGLQVGRDVFEAALQGPHNRLRVVVGPA
jgi:cellobiose phosphorylase